MLYAIKAEPDYLKDIERYKEFEDTVILDVEASIAIISNN
jgi:hypothetical protein